MTLGADGAPRHFYSAHPRMSDDIDQRGIDLLAPVWHVLDLTPPGLATGTPSWTTPPAAAASEQPPQEESSD